MKILIVGAGLSGCCLAHQFLAEGKDVCLIDKGVNYSSKIAAGMINPMVFRRMLKTWKGDTLIPYLNSFYPRLEQKLKQRFFFPLKIRRVFSTAEEASLWSKREQDPSYANYIYTRKATPSPKNYVIHKYGSAYVKSPGYVDATMFIRANHSFFIKKNILKYADFDYSKLNLETTTYNNTQYESIIFAEGFHGKTNPFFDYLPLKQDKGEVLTAVSSELDKDEILNRKCFVLPTIGGEFKIGATFTWNSADVNTTESAKEELLGHYASLSAAKIEVVHQEAGIRPTVTDRRPLIGKHPTIKNLFIFNGMGAKGYLIAPFFSKHFCDYYSKKIPLDEEVDIKRFFKRFNNTMSGS